MSLSVDKILRRVQKHIKAGELAEAEEVYKRVLYKFPKNKKAIQGYQKLKAGLSFTGTLRHEQRKDQIEELVGLYNRGQFEELVAKGKPLSKLFLNSAEIHICLGESYKKLKMNEEAIKSYQSALKIRPKNAEVYNNMGNVFYEKGDLEASISSFQKSIEIKPDYAEAYNNMGNALHDKGELKAAIESYKQATKIRPDYADAYNNMGVVFKDCGMLCDAIDSYRKTLKINPKNAEAFNNMGISFKEMGDLEAAIENYQKSINIKPDYAEAYSNMSVALKDKGELVAAIENCRQAIKIKSDFAEAYYNMGYTLKEMNDLDAAIESFKHALKIKPNYAEASNSIGIALRQKGELAAAMESYRLAIKIKPECAEFYNNMGNALNDNGDPGSALDHYKQALKVEPDDFVAKTNLAFQISEAGDMEMAITMYREVLECNPGFPAATHNLIYAMSRFDKIGNQELFTETCLYAQAMEAPFIPEWPAHTNSRDPERCLQIGFVSGDFRDHAVAIFCRKLLSRLSQSPSLTTHAYYTKPDEDSVTIDMKNHFQYWSSVGHLSEQQLARNIIEDKIDVLVDLSNHSEGNRLCMFARKPAPLQVTAVGLPCTTGLSAMDYYFGRARRSLGQQFSECYVELPANVAYNPLQELPPVNALPALVNGFITFGSFNKVSKITRSCIALWSKLLRATPNSHFLFAGQTGKGLQNQFEKWFFEEQIELSRISFHPKSNINDYYHFHHRVDVLLMTYPYSGGTTIANALWMGVPSIGLARYGDVTLEAGAILSHAGLQDFFVKTEDDFVFKGCSLANDLVALASIRENLREKFSKSTFCNPNVAAASWEAAIRIIWKRWCCGLDPEPIKFEMEDLKYLS